jgi:hypothetical protein
MLPQPACTTARLLRAWAVMHPCCCRCCSVLRVRSKRVGVPNIRVYEETTLAAAEAREAQQQQYDDQVRLIHTTLNPNPYTHMVACSL